MPSDGRVARPPLLEALRKSSRSCENSSTTYSGAARTALAVDGTRIKAINNKDRNFTRASLAEFIRLGDKKLDDYPQRLDQNDIAEQATGGSRVENLRERSRRFASAAIDAKEC